MKAIIVEFNSNHKGAIKNIRHQVFTLEQRIDGTKDFDGRDDSAVHALIEMNGAYVATGRMLPDGHIGRLAVLKSWRGVGAGRLVVETLMSEASRMGLERVFLGAQKPAAGFYERIGFRAVGHPFEEVGIEHIQMEKILYRRPAMNKIELVDQVLGGESVIRPPISLWYHFGIQHGPGEQLARTALDYFHHYDFDFLKVMNDYFYPPPDGVESISSPKDLKKLVRFNVRESAWQEQFRALEIIAGELKGKAYFIDTVFDAWQTLNRCLVAENLKPLMAQASDDVLEALDRVADNLIDYSKAAIDIGAAGIFLSIPAGAEIVSHDEFMTFVKPFAHKVLAAVAPLGKLTTLHVHGKELFFEDVLDLPAPVFNWWDRGPQGPSLQWVRERIPGCVMGGIDQTIAARRSRPFLRNHVQEALALGGNQRFFLANGCSIDTWIYPESVRTMVETARQGGE